ncbi:hypothetical protein ASS64_09120 [Erythrobacter sp. AP23]|nr:hypothetical protein ASS64_09120 [Erythrobacter sp. AP23]
MVASCLLQNLGDGFRFHPFRGAHDVRPFSQLDDGAHDFGRPRLVLHSRDEAPVDLDFRERVIGQLFE